MNEILQGLALSGLSWIVLGELELFLIKKWFPWSKTNIAIALVAGFSLGYLI